MEQSDLAREYAARFEQLAVDLGTTLEKDTRMRMLEHELDRLIEAQDDWQHPDDVLDPTRNRGIYPRKLHSLCCARIERSNGDTRRKLEEVRDKLERPAELERLLSRFDRRFEALQQWLSEVGDPEAAVESLAEMGRLLRSAMGSAEGE